MFEGGSIRSNLFLLGDSGYLLEVWLMTLFSDPSSPAEDIFHTKHRFARNVVERYFGVMKSRFRIISQSVITPGCSSEKSALIVLAIAFLHICVQFNLGLPDNMVNDSDDDDYCPQSRSQEPLLAIVRRQEIANGFQSAR